MLRWCFSEFHNLRVVDGFLHEWQPDSDDGSGRVREDLVMCFAFRT